MIFLLDDILFAPINGTVWIAEKLKEMGKAEMTDESKVREELLELQMRLELEEISEEEYQRSEDDLMKRLEEIRRYKEEI